MKPARMDVTLILPLSPLWAWRAGDGSDAATLHKAYARGVWHKRSFPERTLLLLRILTWWPISTFALAAACTLFNAGETRRRFGKSGSRQFAEQIALAFRHSVPPPWYYLFGLWDDAKRERAHLYLFRYETKGGVYRLIRAFLRGSAKALNNKLMFHEICSERGLPAPPLVMLLRDGEVAHGEPQLPDADLFVKPVRGKGGLGAERWEWLGDGRYRHHTGEECSREELSSRLLERSREKPQLVQQCLCNHPDLADVSAGALSTARVMTVLNEKDEYEVAIAVFRTSADPTSPVDNFHAHGLVSAVDLETGELGQANGGGTRQIPRVSEMIHHDTHPLTGATITGLRLPFWSDAKELARRAHAMFPGLAIIGWDIAFTPEGPVIVEGNSAPDLDILQLAHRMPMGDTRLAAALAHQVRRAEAEL